ncbi:uncharacterized protein LOC111374526 [Olea europaea var. sylvestris]|uniref:uncharacterized protein LOC111374526 n=1 Tax=Olea europaea var. sylvestris TaxID=158386 RepID=UPI000C1D2439|nr:uncharacterized protein LOC111374526 [Olea europaea var. sylvestris]
MVSEFDLVMQEHLRRAKAKEIQYTYLGKKIQEIKYTYLDASQEEQISLIVRFVDNSANLPTIQEHWLEFLKVDDTTGLGLATELQKALIKIDLDIDDIRGQGLLHAANIVSKFLQTESMDIDHAIDLLQGLVSFLEEYREIGFAIAKDEATKKASEMGIEAFEEVKGCNLFSSLLKSCLNLEKYLQHNGRSDISGDDLCSELQVLRCYIPSEAIRAIEVLQYLKTLDVCFPNAYTAYQILLTIPVTVVSAERSFSKLKLIKTYLRSTMSDAVIRMIGNEDLPMLSGTE